MYLHPLPHTLLLTLGLIPKLFHLIFRQSFSPWPMGDYARRDRKGEKTTDATIVEEQLILRVPPAIAEIVRQGCRGKGELELSFSMGMCFSPLPYFTQLTY